MKDKFLSNSERLDKQLFERSSLTASQLKRRCDQSQNTLKTVQKDQNSREVSPLFKEQNSSARDRERARTLKALLEANAKWNAEIRFFSKSAAQIWRVEKSGK